MNQTSVIDWPKLKAQFGNEALIQRWMQDFLHSSEQDLALIYQAQAEQSCSASLLQQLQGVASLLCCKALNQRAQQLKHSSTLSHDLDACLQCYQQLCAEVRAYLATQGFISHVPAGD